MSSHGTFVQHAHFANGICNGKQQWPFEPMLDTADGRHIFMLQVKAVKNVEARIEAGKAELSALRKAAAGQTTAGSKVMAARDAALSSLEVLQGKRSDVLEAASMAQVSPCTCFQLLPGGGIASFSNQRGLAIIFTWLSRRAYSCVRLVGSALMAACLDIVYTE